MTVNVSDLERVLNRLFDKRFEKLFAYNMPHVGLFPKGTKFGGNDQRHSAMDASTPGGGADFATALANMGPPQYGAFVMTRKRDYSLFQIMTEAILASAESEYGVVQALENVVMAAMHTFKDSISTALFGNGGGSRGRVGSTNAMALTLADPRDHVKFYRGMLIRSCSTDGTSAVGDNDVATITAIDRRNGILYRSDANWTAGGHYSDGDHLFRSADLLTTGGDGTGYNLMLAGLNGWIPETAPVVGGGDSWYSFDRSVDPVKYAGVRAEADANHDGTLGNAILRLLKEVGDEGGDPDTVLCHTDVKLQLIKEVGDQTMHVKAVGSDGKPSTTIGYDVLKFIGPNGPVKVVSTVYCPRSTVWGLTMNTWKLDTLGECPRFLPNVGGVTKYLTAYNADAVQGRLGYYGNLKCYAPGHNGRMDVTDVLQPEAA